MRKVISVISVLIVTSVFSLTSNSTAQAASNSASNFNKVEAVYNSDGRSLNSVGTRGISAGNVYYCYQGAWWYC